MFWMVPSKSSSIWHDGRTSGFDSFMGFSNDGRFGVVVLSGTSRSVTPLGIELLRQMRRNAGPNRVAGVDAGEGLDLRQISCTRPN